MELKMHPTMSLRSPGREYGTGRAVMYAVDGLPNGEEVSIFNCGTSNRASWQVLAAKFGVSSGWTGDYASPEQALAAIMREVNCRTAYREAS